MDNIRKHVVCNTLYEEKNNNKKLIRLYLFGSMVTISTNKSMERLTDNNHHKQLHILRVQVTIIYIGK